MSSIKEYAMSEHVGWFIQPIITRDELSINRGETHYSSVIKISNGKRDFTVEHTCLFATDMDAANGANSNGRKLVDEHLKKYKSCMFYKTGWWLGLFKGHFLKHDDTE